MTARPAWRPALALAAAAAVAALAANILGEYELTTLTAVIAGVVVGFGLAELVLAIGRRGGPAVAVAVAAVAFGCLAWAGWLDSDRGVEAFPPTAWVGAALAAAVAAVRTGRAPARP